MDIKDISIVPTSSYQQVLALMYLDTDHRDLSATLEDCYITNNSDLPVIIKNTSKGVAPTGNGRYLDVGQTIHYPSFDARRCYMKTSSGSIASGSIIISGLQN